jgi:hypothetical protein
METFLKDARDKARSAGRGIVMLALLSATAASMGQRPEAHPYARPGNTLEPALFAEGAISTADDESHAHFTADGRTVYFLKNTPSFNFWTIVVSRFRDGKWTTPRVAPFSGQYSDADPFITADGSKLFFISTRPVDGKARTDTDLWVCERTGGGWMEPEHLGPLVNSDTPEWFPTVAANGTLYFGSARPGGKGATDIWRSRLVNGKYTEPENLGDAINSPASEVEPYIAPDESYLIFAAAGRPGGRGAFDLYISTQKDGQWSPPVNLGDKINSPAWDFAPRISPDGKYFFFTSARGFGDAAQARPLTYEELSQKLHRPGNGLRDIYQVDAKVVLTHIGK